MLELFSTASTALIEHAVNQALSLDSHAQSRLVALTGKCLHLTIKKPDISLTIIFTDGGVSIHPTVQDNSQSSAYDTKIEGKSFELLQLLTADDPASALFKSNITIDGDQQLAQATMKLFGELDIDWEYQLSRVTGDVLAHQLGQGLRASSKWLHDSHQSMMKNIEEYIHHELQALPHHSEVDYYYQQVSHLRLQADRLEARVNRIVQQRASQPITKASSLTSTPIKGE